MKGRALARVAANHAPPVVRRLARNHAVLVEAKLLNELTGPHPGPSRADLLTGALRIVLRRR